MKDILHTKDFKVFFFSVVSLLSPLEKEAGMKDKVYELFLSFFTHMLYKTERKYLSQEYKRKVGVKGGK